MFNRHEHSVVIEDGIQTGSLQKCPHCGGHFLLASKGSFKEARKTLGELAKPKVFCSKCGRLTCGGIGCNPELYPCVPIEARLEHAEGKRTIYTDNIQDMTDKIGKII